MAYFVYSDTQTLNHITTSTVAMNAASGKKCTLSQMVDTCTYAATGKITFVAAGTVWFEYGSPVEKKSDKAAGKHYKCGQFFISLHFGSLKLNTI